MKTSRKYANPPVVEALCEVSFSEPRWDATVPGRFFEVARRQGLVAEKESVVREAVHATLGGGAPTAAVSAEPKLRFRNADRSRVIQVDQGLIVVNQLRPYPTFDDWRPTVIEAARLYQGLVDAQFVRRVGLRYINEIDLPGSRIDLKEWFQVEPKLPAAWEDAAGSFMLRVEKRVDRDVGLVLTFGSATSPSPDIARFALDLYAICKPVAPMLPEEVPGVMDKAHAAIESAFESSITDKLRARFAAPPS
jgi:uncharacterized protein (TIGR04255 family)